MGHFLTIQFFFFLNFRLLPVVLNSFLNLLMMANPQDHCYQNGYIGQKTENSHACEAVYKHSVSDTNHAHNGYVACESGEPCI